MMGAGRPRWSRNRSWRRSTSGARCARSTTNGARTGGSRSGAEARRRGHRQARTGCSRPGGTGSVRSRRVPSSTIKATVITPGLDVSSKFEDRHSASIVTVPRRARRHCRKDRALFVSSCSPSASPKALEHARHGAARSRTITTEPAAVEILPILRATANTARRLA